MLKLSSLSGNTQRLDGGAMFGNAPRALWSRWAPPDELGRIRLACRCFLVEDGERRILLETGIGTFFDPKLRDRFGVVEDRHVLLDSLADLGLSDADMDVVVLSHLHFDHAGGLLAPYVTGTPPRLLFPRARFVVGRAAFERARQPHLRDRASFIPELPALLEATQRLEVLDDLARASDVLGNQIELRETFGHTVGMLHVTLRGGAASAFFGADLVPGSAWVHLPITMGYDRFPEQLIEEKQQVFEQLAADSSFLLFTHDPDFAAARVQRDDRGRFSAMDPQPVLSRWDLDEAAIP